MRHQLAALALALAIATCYGAQAAEVGKKTVHTTLYDAAGKPVGTARLTQTPHGVLIRAEFTELPPGTHAFQIYETGKCEPPFTSAHDHFNPDDRQHGFLNPQGYHAGDLPNLHVPKSGAYTVEHLVTRATLSLDGYTTLVGGDGTALIVHQGADDYETDPGGNAGKRIACGVVMAKEE